MPDLGRVAKNFSDITFPQTSDIRAIVGGTTIRKYNLHFAATYKQGAVAGTLAPEAPFSIIRRLSYYLGGAPLRDADGRFWRWWNKMQNFSYPPASVAPSMSGGATTPISFDLTMDLVQPDLLPPADSAFLLDTRGLDVNFTFDWGNPIGDLDVSAQTGSTLTSPSMRIQAVDEAAAIGKASKLQVSRFMFTPSQISALGTKDSGNAIQGKGPSYRGIAVSARSGNADWNEAAGDDTVIAYVSLVGDNAIKFYDRVPYADIQADNKKVYGFNDPGWLLLDFARDRTLNHVIWTLTDRGRISDLVLTLEFPATVPTNPWCLIYPLNHIYYSRPAQQPGARPMTLSARR